MRVVRIKLESDNYDSYKAKLKKQRTFWTLIYLALITTLVFEIFASLFNSLDIWSFPFLLKFSAEIMGLLTDVAIIVILWTHFSYFFQRKKQALTKQYGVFKKKQKALVIWSLIVLISNSILLVISNAIEMIILFSPLSAASFIKVWRIVAYYWFDLMNLNNSILILWMYMYLTRKMKPLPKPGQKRKKNVRPSDIS